MKTKGSVGVLLLLALTGIWKMEKAYNADRTQEEQEQKQKIAQATREFGENIARAKRATADPCATVFYESVESPSVLGVTPHLVIMGEEIRHELDPTVYELRANGDHVELWVNLGYPPGSAEKKIGEKFSPDSPRCQSK